MQRHSSHILIIGTGLAGYNLARSLRQRDNDCAITLISEDDGRYYSKPQLSTGFSKGKSAEDLTLNSAQEMADKLGCTIVTNRRVLHIDKARQRVECDDNSVLDYDSLILATGAIPAPPRWQGNAPSHAINDLHDYAQFRGRLTRGDHIAIAGAGLVGCEYANDLTQAGFKVSVFDPMPLALGNLLPEAAATVLTQALERAGIKLHLQKPIETAILTNGGDLTLSLPEGDDIKADVLLSAIGLEPNTQLAHSAGLRVNKGIMVDRYMRTSEPNIYAIGDCAEVAGLVLYYVLPLMAQVKALCATLCGEPSQVVYGPMPVMVKTTLHPVSVLPPPPDAQGAWQTESEHAEGAEQHFIAPGGQLLGYALTGNRLRQNAKLMRQCPALLA